ncbi:MAG: arginyl-transferase family protein, partial [Alphaproteobacteria bacterium]
SLRRVAARNGDLVVEIRGPRASQEQYALFTRYQRSRHNGGEMAAMTFADYRAMVEDTAVNTQMVEYYNTDRRLIAAILIDRLGDGLSAVYSFFEPEETDRSLGTYMILWLIDRATALHLPHVYLGYWIQQSSKMAYKMRFQPLETLRPEGWQRLDPR